MTHPPIRILRLSRPAPIATAAVFEDYFVEALAPDVEVAPRPSGRWLRSALGDDLANAPLHAMGGRVARACAGFDFLCPDYDSAPFAALLAAARNAFEDASAGTLEDAGCDPPTEARVGPRLLLIAHAPGCMAYDLEPLAPHLRPGDRIVCPSESARRILLLLAPSVAPFARVIPHPISLEPDCVGQASSLSLQALPGFDGGIDKSNATRRDRQDACPTPPRIVALTRLHPTKLLHRAIDALAILRSRGIAVPEFEIAGSLDGPAEDAYARTLRARIARHGLEDHVRLVGAIEGRAAKADFLRGAHGLVNLSVTVEESFGKAPAEALAAGVPALVTAWDGLPETIGAAGSVARVSRPEADSRARDPHTISPEDTGEDACATTRATPADQVVPVIFSPVTGEPDVRAEDVADALQRLLRTPPTREACLREAERFAPARVRAEYERALRDALAERVAECVGTASSPSLRAPSPTILSEIAPFASMTEPQAFDLYRREMTERLARLAPAEAGDSSIPPDASNRPDPTEGEVLRRIAATALARIVQHALAAREPPDDFRVLIEGEGDGRRAEPMPSEPMRSGGPRTREHDFASLLRTGAAATATERSRVLCAHELLLADEIDAAHLAVERLKSLGCASQGLHYLELELELARADSDPERESEVADRLHALLGRGPLAGLGSDESDPRLDDAHLSSRLRQFARACRGAGSPGRAVPALREWLRRFPDEPESGSVWLALAVNALRDPATPLEFAGEALRHARAILPPSGISDRVEEEYARRVAGVVAAVADFEWSEDESENEDEDESEREEGKRSEDGTAGLEALIESVGEFEAIPLGHRGRTFRLRPRPLDPQAARAPEFTLKTMGPADDPAVAARFDLLAAIHASGFPMPAPLRRIDAEGIAYLLAERVEGTPLSELSPDARRAAWIHALDALGRLRRTPLPHALSQSPTPHPLRLEEAWLARVESVASRRPETRAMYERLLRTRPAGPLVLAHGDFAEPNLLRADDGRLVILDWEEAGLGCDGFDAGRLLALDRMGAATPFSREALRARLLASDAAHPDESANGAPGPSPESLAWFEDLALLRMLHRVPELPFGVEMRELIAARIVDRIRTRE